MSGEMNDQTGVEETVPLPDANEILRRRDEQEALQRKAEAELEARREAEIATKRAQRERLAGFARQFKPRGDLLLVQMTIRERTRGGLVLADDKKQLPTQGTVIALGPDVKLAKLGDRAMFSQWVGCSIELPSGDRMDEFRVLPEAELYGFWPDEVVQALARDEAGA